MLSTQSFPLVAAEDTSPYRWSSENGGMERWRKSGIGLLV